MTVIENLIIWTSETDITGYYDNDWGPATDTINMQHRNTKSIKK